MKGLLTNDVALSQTSMYNAATFLGLMLMYLGAESQVTSQVLRAGWRCQDRPQRFESWPSFQGAIPVVCMVLHCLQATHQLSSQHCCQQHVGTMVALGIQQLLLVCSPGHCSAVPLSGQYMPSIRYMPCIAQHPLSSVPHGPNLTTQRAFARKKNSSPTVTANIWTCVQATNSKVIVMRCLYVSAPSVQPLVQLHPQNGGNDSCQAAVSHKHGMHFADASCPITADAVTAQS
jgi:hypothetical protein